MLANHPLVGALNALRQQWQIGWDVGSLGVRCEVHSGAGRDQPPVDRAQFLVGHLQNFPLGCLGGREFYSFSFSRSARRVLPDSEIPEVALQYRFWFLK